MVELFLEDSSRLTPVNDIDNEDSPYMFDKVQNTSLGSSENEDNFFYSCKLHFVSTETCICNSW